MKNTKSSNGAFSLLLPELRRAVDEAGYETPSPIQEQTIPALLEGRDMLGCAQTGTGKTAAFTLPILQYLANNPKKAMPKQPRVLILAPTRELAAQIRDSVAGYGKYTDTKHAVIFGGVSQNAQIKATRLGVDVLVATPGRLLDLMNQKFINLASIEIFVLDEADRMLDMGFIHDIKKVIAKLPRKRQSLFYSATMEAPVVALARTLVHNPVHVTVEPEKPTVDRIVQSVMFVDKSDKDKLLVELFKNQHLERVLVFVQMKHLANKVAATLKRERIPTEAIHGNKSQGARTRALAGFKAGRVKVLVATDIAARGIDVNSISHVINYDMPVEPETYVHRIGRTARAGAEGDAISFCSAPERDYLRAVEKLIRITVPVDSSHPTHSDAAMNATGDAAKPQPRGQNRGRGRSGPKSRERSHSGGKRPASRGRRLQPRSRGRGMAKSRG